MIRPVLGRKWGLLLLGAGGIVASNACGPPLQTEMRANPSLHVVWLVANSNEVRVETLAHKPSSGKAVSDPLPSEAAPPEEDVQAGGTGPEPPPPNPPLRPKSAIVATDPPRILYFGLAAEFDSSLLAAHEDAVYGVDALPLPFSHSGRDPVAVRLTATNQSFTTSRVLRIDP